MNIIVFIFFQKIRNKKNHIFGLTKRREKGEIINGKGRWVIITNTTVLLILWELNKIIDPPSHYFLNYVTKFCKDIIC